MYEQATSPTDNILLALLSQEGLDDLDLKSIRLRSGDVLLPSDEEIGYVYFPTTAIVAVLGNMATGRTAEVGIIGRESVVGASALLGDQTSPLTRVIQVPGEVFRAPLAAVKREFDEHEDFRKGVLASVQDFTNQVAMTVVCNRVHSMEQRLIRWLLMRHDRMEGDIIPVTHEYISLMLGVHRSTVTVTATHLQQIGLINYTWGRITIRNRDLMEEHVCECYSGPPKPLRKDAFVEGLLAIGFS
jgi:CRP-like cAMP-binding protein